MSNSVIIKNTQSHDVTYAGQVIAPSEEYKVIPTEIEKFAEDSNLFSDVSTGAALIGNAIEFFEPIYGWGWLTGSYNKSKITQASDSQGNKVAVHSSAKPMVVGKSFYTAWIGAGDNVTTGEISGGDFLVYNLPEPVSPETDVNETKEVFFHPANGQVYLSDGFLKWKGAMAGDYITAYVEAAGTPLQQVVNLDLIVENNWIKYSPSGPGTGTHGFADASKISLVKRSYTRDGDWDYSEDTGLVPNPAGNGFYKISDIKRTVHVFINKMPLIGDSSNFALLGSDESMLLPAGYSVKIEVHNTTPGTLEAAIMLFVYRQKTYEIY